MKTIEKIIEKANILKVVAGTNGFKGGDTGHGSETKIILEDLGSTDISFKVQGNGRKLTIDLGGDSELESIIEALEAAAKVLRVQSGYTD